MFLFYFFQFFSYWSKSGNQPQEDLAKYSYKKNKKIENLGNLLHAGKPLKPIS
jgi:hypothetical protein